MEIMDDVVQVIKRICAKQSSGKHKKMHMHQLGMCKKNKKCN